MTSLPATRHLISFNRLDKTNAIGKAAPTQRLINKYLQPGITKNLNKANLIITVVRSLGGFYFAYKTTEPNRKLFKGIANAVIGQKKLALQIENPININANCVRAKNMRFYM